MINLNSTLLCKKIYILLTLKFFDILGYYDIALSSFTISHRRFDKSNTNATGKECTSLPFRGHLCSSPLFRVVCVAPSLVFCVVFCRSPFVIFLLAIVLSVLLRFADSGDLQTFLVGL
jgi:hypothetical protein